MNNKDQGNVNITLEHRRLQAKRFLGKHFPCPVCGMALALRIASTGKPYCHCDECAIQLFFRGKTGIQRLEKLIDSGVVAGTGASNAVVLYNRLLRLKADKRELERQRGLFRNADLENAISAVQKESEVVGAELARISGRDGRARK